MARLRGPTGRLGGAGRARTDDHQIMSLQRPKTQVYSHSRKWTVLLVESLIRRTEVDTRGQSQTASERGPR